MSKLSPRAAQATFDATAILNAAANCWDTRHSLVMESTAKYGYDVCRRISGCEQEHWPEEMQNELRRLARAWSSAIDDARTVWRKGRRRADTLRAFRDARPDAGKLRCYF